MFCFLARIYFSVSKAAILYRHNSPGYIFFSGERWFRLLNVTGHSSVSIGAGVFQFSKFICCSFEERKVNKAPLLAQAIVDFPTICIHMRDHAVQ